MGIFLWLFSNSLLHEQVLGIVSPQVQIFELPFVNLLGAPTLAEYCLWVMQRAAPGHDSMQKEEILLILRNDGVSQYQ